MTKVKIAFITVSLFALALIICGCGCRHVYDDAWQLTKIPTQAETGVAERACKSCGKTESIVLAALDDSSVWSQNTVAASHEQNGEIIYTSVYGTVEVTLDKVRHTFNCEIATDKYLATNATCKQAAIYYKSCECGAVGSETFEHGLPLGHEAAFVSSNAADCYKSGNIPYWHCSRCGGLFLEEACSVEITPADVVLDALGHNYGDYSIIEEPTSTTDGVAQRVCSRNNSHVDMLSLPNLTSAQWNKTEIEVTYFNDGSEVYVWDEYNITINKITRKKLTAPYENKTYKIYDVVKAKLYDNELTFDAYGKGSATVTPFDKIINVSEYSSSGNIKITTGDTIYEGVVGSNALMVVSCDDLKTPYLLLPAECFDEVYSVAINDKVFAVSIAYNNEWQDIFVAEDVTYLNASFTNSNGDSIVANADVENIVIYVDGKVVASFKNTGGVFSPFDPTTDYDVDIAVYDAYGGNRTITVNSNDIIVNALPHYDIYTVDVEHNCLFDGWYLDGNCTVALAKNATPLTIDGVVYAKWTTAGSYYAFRGSLFGNFTYGETVYVDNGETISTFGFTLNTSGSQRSSAVDAIGGDIVVSFKYWLFGDAQDTFAIELCSRDDAYVYTTIDTLVEPFNGAADGAKTPKQLTVRIRGGNSVRFVVTTSNDYGACVGDLTINGVTVTDTGAQ